MTPCGPAEITATVTELCSALVRLDHPAVDLCCNGLEMQLSALRSGCVHLSPGESEQLRRNLMLASTLVKNAEHLYAGWARAAVLAGGAYGATGLELPSPVSCTLIGQA